MVVDIMAPNCANGAIKIQSIHVRAVSLKSGISCDDLEKSCASPSISAQLTKRPITISAAIDKINNGSILFISFAIYKENNKTDMSAWVYVTDFADCLITKNGFNKNVASI